MERSKRHTHNPFIKNELIPIGTKNVQITSLGKDANVLVNRDTGEVTGTHIIARKRVDKEKFVKTYADYMAFTFDLTRSGNKTLRVVMWAVAHHALGKDIVVLDKYTLEEFLEHLDGAGINAFSYTVYARGLGELVRANIIAKASRPAHYYINPHVMFNGDRIAFSTVIEKESEEQGELFRHEENR